MGKTMRAILARRLKFTDELLANVRQRYEHTDEPLSTMAADLGCCKTTLRGIAKREGWVRYEAPPRELLPAARLAARAEKLASSPSPPLIPAQAGIRGQDRDASALSPGSPLARGRADIEAPPTPNPSPPFAARMGGGEKEQAPPGGGEERERADRERENAEALHAAVEKELAEFKVERAQLKGKPLGLLERERAARTLAGLTRTLHIVQAMRCGAPLSESHHDNAYDDMPADLDAFRDQLARRIAAFMESRPDAGDADEAVADRADETR